MENIFAIRMHVYISPFSFYPLSNLEERIDECSRQRQSLLDSIIRTKEYERKKTSHIFRTKKITSKIFGKMSFAIVIYTFDFSTIDSGLSSLEPVCDSLDDFVDNKKL